jgi:hypothetical protein
MLGEAAGWVEQRHLYNNFMNITNPGFCLQCPLTQLDILVSENKIERADTRIRLVPPRVSANSYNPLD